MLKIKKVIVLLGIVLVYLTTRSYFVFSRNAMWLDIDTSRMTQYISTIYMHGKIDVGPIYVNGYLYPVLGAIHSIIIGISPFEYQFIFHPFLSIFIIFPAYLMMREFFSSGELSLIYTYIVLNCFSELIFNLSRGSHFSFTIYMTLLLLAILLKIIKLKIYDIRFLSFLIIFFYTISSSNIYFSSLILPIIIVTQIFKNYNFRDLSNTIPYVSILIAQIFLFYQNGSKFYTVIFYGTILRLKDLLLGQITFENPIYSKSIFLWDSKLIYILLIQSELIVSVSTLFIFLLIILRSVKYGSSIKKTISILLVWYLVLGISTTIALLSDFLGVGFGGNFGVRVFDVFLIVATAIFSSFIFSISKRSRVMAILFIIWLIISPISATIKATTPRGISGYINEYSESSVYSITWLNSKGDKLIYISTLNTSITYTHLDNLITLFAPSNISLSSNLKGYFYINSQITWFVEWASNKGYKIWNSSETITKNVIYTSSNSLIMFE